MELILNAIYHLVVVVVFFHIYRNLVWLFKARTRDLARESELVKDVADLTIRVRLLEDENGEFHGTDHSQN